jgi:hypothetical protein
VPVEPETEAGMADDVVDGAKAVERAPDRHMEERMALIAVEPRRAQLEHSF